MRRRSTIILGVALAIATFLSGCGGNATTPSQSPAPGTTGTNATSTPAAKKDTLVIAQDNDVPTLDPHMHAERVAIIVDWHIYDSLLSRDPKTMQIIPGLAESYKTINDTTWEFKLRQGVKFHNGEEFNADVVKFTIDRVLDPNQKSPQRGNISSIKEVKVVDPYTVDIITKVPYPVLPERLAFLCMVPPKYLKEVGDQQFALKPVGTGPYKFVSWTKGDRVVLIANENYWKGTAKIKNVIFRAIPEQATQLNELASGGVDILRYLTPDLANQVTQGGNSVATAPIIRFWHFSMNPAYKPFDDVNFRLAIQHAINVDAIITSIFGGKAERIPAMVNPKQFGFDQSVKAPTYDPNLAKQYLAKSSYHGEPITIEHYMKGAGPAVMDAIIADLKAVGINAEAKFYPDSSALAQRTLAGKTAIDGGTWGSNSTFDADGVLQAFFGVDGSYGKYHQFDPKADQLIQQARGTLDAAKRKQLYSQVQQMVVDEAMDISLFAPYDIYGINKNLDYTPRADEVVYAYDASWK